MHPIPRPTSLMLPGLWIALALALPVPGCASNPTPRCGPSLGCASPLNCYRGFCIQGGSDGGSSCRAGLTNCGECVDLRSDDHHCGGCEVRCDRRCESGTCVEGD